VNTIPFAQDDLKTRIHRQLIERLDLAKVPLLPFETVQLPACGDSPRQGRLYALPCLDVALDGEHVGITG